MLGEDRITNLKLIIEPLKENNSLLKLNLYCTGHTGLGPGLDVSAAETCAHSAFVMRCDATRRTGLLCEWAVNYISAMGMRHLATVLEVNRTLTHLDLRCT